MVEMTDADIVADAEADAAIKDLKEKLGEEKFQKLTEVDTVEGLINMFNEMKHELPRDLRELFGKRKTLLSILTKLREEK